jgi:hypothetical protein
MAKTYILNQQALLKQLNVRSVAPKPEHKSVKAELQKLPIPQTKQTPQQHENRTYV